LDLIFALIAPGLCAAIPACDGINKVGVCVPDFPAPIGDRVPHERRGQMLGLYESSRGLGGLVSPVIGFMGMFLVMAAIAALGFMVMMLGKTVLGRRITVGDKQLSGSD
jgi:hypothetical protein